MAERELTTDAELRGVLTAARTIAVLGAHADESRAAHYVPAYLHAQGYRVLPVNAVYAKQQWWGEAVRAALPEIGEPVDIVDVFRGADKLDGHLEEILGMSPRPRLVWLQLGVRNDAFAEKLLAAGIAVVQDRCTLAEHQRLIG